LSTQVTSDSEIVSILSPRPFTSRESASNLEQNFPFFQKDRRRADRPVNAIYDLIEALSRYKFPLSVLLAYCTAFWFVGSFKINPSSSACKVFVDHM